MTQQELISKIAIKNKTIGFKQNPPATNEQLVYFQKRVGFEMPSDFQMFYAYCNGFETIDDIFNFMSLESILEDDRNFGNNWFYFAEYMIFSDMWAVKVFSREEYEIYIVSSGIVLTRSLVEFLQRFLLGNIFEPGGLDSWQTEVFNK